MIIVSDTSPVRALVAIGRSEILYRLFKEIYIPKAVESELLRIALLKNQIMEFLNQRWVIIQAVNHDDTYRSIRKILDEGESEAIALAISLGAELLLMDEHKGREVAKEKMLKPLGLIGVMLKAKKEKHLAVIKPDLDKLIKEHGFWLDAELYKEILRKAGE